MPEKEFYPYLTDREENIIKDFARKGNCVRWGYPIQRFSSLVRKGWLEKTENMWNVGRNNFWYKLTDEALESGYFD